MELKLSNVKVAALLSLAFLNIVAAQTSALSQALYDLCTGVKDLVPVAAMLMITLAAVMTPPECAVTLTTVGKVPPVSVISSLTAWPVPPAATADIVAPPPFARVRPGAEVIVPAPTRGDVAGRARALQHPVREAITGHRQGADRKVVWHWAADQRP